MVWCMLLCLRAPAVNSAGTFGGDWGLHPTLQHWGPVRVESGAAGSSSFCGGGLFDF